MYIFFYGYTDEMPKIPQQEIPPEQPPVVQVVYQIPAEDAPILPERLSVLEGKTGLVLIFFFALWGLVWYVFSRESEKPAESQIETRTSVDNF